jgi:hypothetical protein
LKGLLVHVTDHQHAPRQVILDHRGDEAAGFCKIQIHCCAIKSPPCLPAGVLSNLIEFQSEDHPSHMGMVMMLLPRGGSDFHKPLV